jgi:serine/threonine protein kinase
VLFDDAGVARLADFGVAHLGDLSATATAGVIGTLAYMSPEQREGRPATVRSDLYGVGAVLREMLTGERPRLSEASRTLPSAVHRDLDTRHDEAVLRLVAEDAAERPDDAFAARRALLLLPWPHSVERPAPRPLPVKKASVRPAPMRLDVSPDGEAFDLWIDRPIERVRLDERALTRARVFVRASHPALQLVLRVDRDAGEIWLEKPRGQPLARPLTQAERSTLRAAIEALHAAGAAHGRVDRRHVTVDGAGGVILSFARDFDATTTADLDQLALAAL